MTRNWRALTVSLLCAVCALLSMGQAGKVISLDRGRIDEAYKPRRLALVVGINQFDDSR